MFSPPRHSSCRPSGFTPAARQLCEQLTGPLLPHPAVFTQMIVVRAELLWSICLLTKFHDLGFWLERLHHHSSISEKQKVHHHLIRSLGYSKRSSTSWSNHYIFYCCFSPALQLLLWDFSHCCSGCSHVATCGLGYLLLTTPHRRFLFEGAFPHSWPGGRGLMSGLAAGDSWTVASAYSMVHIQPWTKENFNVLLAARTNAQGAHLDRKRAFSTRNRML